MDEAMLKRVLNAVLGDQLEPMLDRKLNEVLDNKLEPMLDRKLNEVLDNKLEPMLDRKLNEVLDNKLDAALGQKLPQMFEEKLAPIHHELHALRIDVNRTGDLVTQMVRMLGDARASILNTEGKIEVQDQRILRHTHQIAELQEILETKHST